MLCCIVAKGIIMDILIINEYGFSVDELKDNINKMNARSYYSSSKEQSIILMNNHQIDLVFLYLNSLDIEELEILRYINENYKNTKVIIRADKEMIDAISIINNGFYAIVEDPVKNIDLRNNISTN